MKILLTCNECFIQKNLISFVDVTPEENNICHFTCQFGHESTAYIQAFKFELLFESGLCAIRDKYYLESVLSLTASLERFYEFTTKLLLKANKVSNTIYQEMFKKMSNQSERQLGAFICIYTCIYKECPNLLDTDTIGFRNKVVHKGYLPTEEEVINYAEKIYNTIKPIYIKMRKEYQEMITEMILDDLKHIAEKNIKLYQKEGKQISTLEPSFSFSSTLSLELFEKQSFHECWQRINNIGIY